MNPSRCIMAFGFLLSVFVAATGLFMLNASSAEGIYFTGGLAGWGNYAYYKGDASGFGMSGGGGFDPVAAAKAKLSGAFTDKDFLNALQQYAMAISKNEYTGTVPSFMEWLEDVYASQGGTGDLQGEAMAELTEEGTPLSAGNPDEQALFDSLLEDAVEVAANYPGMSPGSVSGVQSIKDWSTSMLGGGADVINYDLGLWYDASAGNIKYMNTDGTKSNYVNGDATGYMYGMVTSSSDVSACDEAFGADSWLSDSIPYDGGAGGGGGGGGGGSGSATADGCSSNSDCGSNKTCKDGDCIESAAAISPVVTNETNPTQTVSAPSLTVSTDRAATCQYKTSSFTYGNGTTFDTTGQKGHTYKLNSLSNGTYTYYVVCKDNETGGVSVSTTVTFAVDLSQDSDNAPTVENRTDASFNSTAVLLAVNTNTQSTCQYNEAGGFTYGNGTNFETSGNYNHNANLTGISEGTHTYYVVCKDNATNAASAARSIAFSVDLPDQNNAPEITSITTSTQTSNSPVLAVTTDVAATCQYKQSVTFDYGSGISLAAANENHSHSVSISSLSDGAYTFYVICKSDETSVVSVAKAITTTLDRPDTDTQEPGITNKTAGYQIVANPTLSAGTDVAATCQYKTSSFTYGNGTPFSTTGGTVHNAELSGLNDGPHIYYIVCQGSNGNVNSSNFEIIFNVAVDTGADTCAELSSNDRQNNGDRSGSEGGGGAGAYLWQAVETGEREKFESVDWFAGYQFSLNKDGYATELCGYFAEGETNEIFLYNGSYKELASVEVTGTDSWKCVDIDAVSLKTDTRYYVITQVTNRSLYYEYKSDFLPVDTGIAVIEAGVRQSVNSAYNKNIVKYDYMIFGLVDVKVVSEVEATKGPIITSTSPSGKVYNSSAYLSVEADKDSNCRFDREDVDYEDMNYSLPKVADGTYSQLICNLADGEFTFYVRCADEDGKENDASAAVKFTVED